MMHKHQKSEMKTCFRNQWYAYKVKKSIQISVRGLIGLLCVGRRLHCSSIFSVPFNFMICVTIHSEETGTIQRCDQRSL